MALLAPRWPTAISRGAAAVLPASVSLTVFRGTADPIGDPALITRLSHGATVLDIAGADHHVAIRHPELLLDAMTNQANSWNSAEIAGDD